MHGGPEGEGGGGGRRGGPPPDVDTTKLYEILGIEKDASENDIKKAYRKLALKVTDDAEPCCTVMKARHNLLFSRWPFLFSVWPRAGGRKDGWEKNTARLVYIFTVCIRVSPVFMGSIGGVVVSGGEFSMELSQLLVAETLRHAEEGDLLEGTGLPFICGADSSGLSRGAVFRSLFSPKRLFLSASPIPIKIRGLA